MATAEQKARQRAKRKSDGGRQVSASLNGEEIALLDGLKKDHPEMSQKEIIVSALRLYRGKNQPTDDELLDMLRERLRK